MNYDNYMVKKNKAIKVWKAIMVSEKTHREVVVRAKKVGVRVDEFINNLLKGNDK